MMWVKQRKGWRMSCDVTSPTSQLILQPFRLFTYITAHSSSTSVASPTSKLILQPLRRSIYITAYSPTPFPLLHLRHSSFSNLCAFSNISITSPTSQLIFQPFRRFAYIRAHSPTLPFLHLRHSSFSNPSFASTTSQALHLIHLASRP